MYAFKYKLRGGNTLQRVGKPFHLNFTYKKTQFG